MANEFIARKGIISLDSAQVTGSLSVTNNISASIISGSFRGDGSQLTGISAGFPYTGSAEITGSLTVTGSVSATTFFGDGSQLTGIGSPVPVTATVNTTNTPITLTTQSIVVADSTDGNLTINLPDLNTIVGTSNQKPIIVYKNDYSQNVIYVQPSGSQLVNGASQDIIVSIQLAVIYNPTSAGWVTEGTSAQSLAELELFFLPLTETGSLATTGSNTFIGNQIVTGSLTVTGGINATITGSATSASYVEYVNVANKPTLVSSSTQIVGYNIFATTGSNQFNGSQVVTGSLTVTGQVVAQTLNVQQVTSSIVYSSGSNIFGNTLGNTQQFTGSLQVSGSSHYVLGSVGVGIATPTNPLHIASNTLSQLNIQALSGNTNAQINLEPAGTGIALIGPANNIDFAFRTNATERMRITSGGNLYVGNTDFTSPNGADKFIGVYGGQDASLILQDAVQLWELYVNDDFYITSGATPRLTINRTTGAATFSSTLQANGNAFILPTLSGGGAGGGLYLGVYPDTQYTKQAILVERYASTLGNYGRGSLHFCNRDTADANQPTLADSRMVITSAGNVGIGTASPTQKLVVEGSEAILSVVDNRSFAAGVGGALYLFGNYRSVGDVTVAGYIKGSKVNSTDGDYGFNLIFGTQTYTGGVSEKMRITSTGNVGIGTDNPSQKLEVVGGEIKAGRVDSSNEGGQVSFGRASDNNTAWYIDAYGNTSSPELRFVNVSSAAVAMTIIGSNVLVGNQLQVAGTINTFVDFSGTVCRFYGGSATNTFGLGANSTMYYQGDASQFYPTVDNGRSLGLSSNRYTAVWAVNGTIQTSDEREKKDITNTDLGLDFINQLRPVSYKWKVGQNIETTETTIDEEGNEQTNSTVTPRAGLRTHYGLIAQEVKEILGDKDFGGYIHDQETDTIGLRYDQFIAPMIKAIQEQQTQIESLKAEIQTLKQ